MNIKSQLISNGYLCKNSMPRTCFAEGSKGWASERSKSSGAFHAILREKNHLIVALTQQYFFRGLQT